MMTSSWCASRGRGNTPDSDTGPTGDRHSVAGMTPGMTIVGYAVLNGALIEETIRDELRQLGEPTDGLYGALFVYEHDGDGATTKWTFFTADPAFAEMLTKGTGNDEFDPQMLRTKLPAYQPGWVITTDS